MRLWLRYLLRRLTAVAALLILAGGIACSANTEGGSRDSAIAMLPGILMLALCGLLWLGYALSYLIS